METKTLKFPVLHNGEPRELQQIKYKKYKENKERRKFINFYYVHQFIKEGSLLLRRPNVLWQRISKMVSQREQGGGVRNICYKTAPSGGNKKKQRRP